MTTKQVKKLLKENNRTGKEFMEFMIGQTIGGTPNNPDWYECDVDRFIKRQPVVD